MADGPKLTALPNGQEVQTVMPPCGARKSSRNARHHVYSGPTDTLPTLPLDCTHAVHGCSSGIHPSAAQPPSPRLHVRHPATLVYELTAKCRGMTPRRFRADVTRSI